VMQKIWDATSRYDYEITTSTAIYQKVCDWLHSRIILRYIPDGSMPLRLLAQCYRMHRHHSPLGILQYPRKLIRFRCRTCRVCKVLPGGSSLFVSSKQTWQQKVCDPERSLFICLIITYYFSEMEEAFSQPLCPPDICCSPHGYRRFHEDSWSPWQTYDCGSGWVRLDRRLGTYCVFCLQCCLDCW
jgi:hypothetical protein